MPSHIYVTLWKNENNTVYTQRHKDGFFKDVDFESGIQSSKDEASEAYKANWNETV